VVGGVAAVEVGKRMLLHVRSTSPRFRQKPNVRPVPPKRNSKRISERYLARETIDVFSSQLRHRLHLRPVDAATVRRHRAGCGVVVGRWGGCSEVGLRDWWLGEGAVGGVADLEVGRGCRCT
jgi:hypothetical protein